MTNMTSMAPTVLFKCAHFIMTVAAFNYSFHKETFFWEHYIVDLAGDLTIFDQ